MMVIAAAMSALIASRTLTGTTAEFAQLQQQGSYALRVMGMQFRQAGSMDPLRDQGTGLHAFEGSYPAHARSMALVHGTDGPGRGSDTVSLIARQAPALADHLRDCLGNTVKAGADMDATFALGPAAELTCTSQRRNAALIGNVADFQVGYRVRIAEGLQLMRADEVDAARQWDAIEAIEICLDLQGSERTPDAAASYTDCQGRDQALDQRIHLVFRNVFDLRTRGR